MRFTDNELRVEDTQTGERRPVQFRSGMFNLIKHANFRACPRPNSRRRPFGPYTAA
jgi:hypothetical protein